VALQIGRGRGTSPRDTLSRDRLTALIGATRSGPASASRVARSHGPAGPPLAPPEARQPSDSRGCRPRLLGRHIWIRWFCGSGGARGHLHGTRCVAADWWHSSEPRGPGRVPLRPRPDDTARLAPPEHIGPPDRASIAVAGCSIQPAHRHRE